MFRNRLFLAATVFGSAMGFGLADSAQAGPPGGYRPPVIVNRSAPVVVNRPATNHMPGWDWRRTYPYSSYNAWRNPYWYYPYTPYYAVSPYYYGVQTSNYYYNNYNYNYLPVPPIPPIE